MEWEIGEFFGGAMAVSGLGFGFRNLCSVGNLLAKKYSGQNDGFEKEAAHCRSHATDANIKILYMLKLRKPLFLAMLISAVSAFADVSNPPDVKLKNPPALENKDSFSMILFGDPQTYSKFSFSQPIFELMTAWTAAHKDALNIKAALCTGDLVELNGMLTKFNPKQKREISNVPSALQ